LLATGGKVKITNERRKLRLQKKNKRKELMKKDERNKENFQCVPQWLNLLLQCDSFGTRPKKMRISQRLFIGF